MSNRLIFFGAFVFLTACQPVVLPPPEAPFVPRGFGCRLLPSQAYSPGFIFRVDESGAEWLTEDLSLETNPKRYTAATGEYIASVKSGLDIQIALTHPLGSLNSAGVSVTASSGTNTTVAFTDASLLLLTDQQTQALLSYATQNINPSSGSRYYIVRDALQAKGIDIKLSSADESKLGGEAKIEGIVSAKPGFSLVRGQSLTIKGTYPDPLNVCIRPVLLEFLDSPAGGAAEPVNDAQSFSWRVSDFVASDADLQKILNLQIR
jgi:hypothetical protein